MKTILIAAGVILGAAAAHAQDVPRFDVKQHCTQVAGFGGSYSQTIYSGCFDMEQRAYDSLKEAWSRLPQSIRSHCENVASFGSTSSYSILQGCVDMEVESGRENSSRSFKY